MATRSSVAQERSQYVFGWNLGIDELLFADPYSPATSHPGRMGINTAINFCLMGTALWLMSRQRNLSSGGSQPSPKSPATAVDRIAIAQWLTIAWIAIAIQAIVGYVYDVPVLYKLSTLTTSMALHTAICFGILGVGVLALTSDRGLMRVVTSKLMGSKVARRLMPTAIGLPLGLGWLILLGLRANWYDPSFALSLMEQTRAEQALRVEQERVQAAQALIGQQLSEIEAIYQSAPVGLCFVDTDLRFVRLNEHLAQINGLPVAAHIGRTSSEIFPAAAETIELLYRQVIESGEPILNLELSAMNPDASGVLRHWIVAYYPQKDPADRVIGVNVTVQEITERVQAQAALEQLTQELDRAAAVLHDRNQELDSFVYVVSHDLKAPLRAISNLSQWIDDDLEGTLSSQMQQHTILLRNRIQRMEATIDGLLDFARIGRSDERLEPIAVAELLAETIDSIAPPPTFKIVIAPDLPTLHTKRLFLSQVFTNLICNGIKHHGMARSRFPAKNTAICTNSRSLMMAQESTQHNTRGCLRSLQQSTLKIERTALASG